MSKKTETKKTETKKAVAAQPAAEVLFYSPSTKGFYSSIIHGDKKPEDCVEVSKEQYDSLLSGQSEGKEIVAIDGALDLKTPKPKAATLETIRRTRDHLLQRSDWTQLADSPLSDEKKARWAEYRQTLRDLPASGPVEKIKFPEQPA